MNASTAPDTQSTSIETLIRQAVELTDSPPPALLDDNAPVFREENPAADAIYLVGLIGGKEVGKSALVNALAGLPITNETSHGPGTESAIAYVYRNRQAELQRLLEREAPGRFTIVPHDQANLGGQVLVDLPDIDSRFSSHLELTRKMLRHMLFPIWMQSVEKYADVQPQNLLAQVAAGNDPANFLFCLNKVDQLPKPEEADELRGDYARRVARVLGMEKPPRVFMLCARQPQAFDLPELARLLSREKTPQNLAQSRQLATRRRQQSLLQWLDRLDLPGRAERLDRLDEQASEIISQRLGIPLVETAIPEILDDAAYRLVMTDGVFARRVARWPIVSAIHSLLAPLRLVIRENASAGSFFGGAESLVDAHLKPSGSTIGSLVQTTFAQLQQTDPTVAGLYERRKLWETMESSAAEARLRQDLIETVKRQRQVVLDRLGGRSGIIAPLFRVLLTVGALLWFPFIQPVLAILMRSGSWTAQLRDAGAMAVQVLNGQALLYNSLFLLVWYLLLLAMLRWTTRSRVDRLLSGWKNAANADPTLNLTTRALQWIDDLLAPIRSARQATRSLNDQAQELRAQAEEAKSAA
jgi:hypothetical protein